MMKQADAVRCAQVEWKQWIVDNEEQYVAALRKVAEHLKRNRMRRIEEKINIKTLSIKYVQYDTNAHNFYLSLHFPTAYKIQYMCATNKTVSYIMYMKQV